MYIYIYIHAHTHHSNTYIYIPFHVSETSGPMRIASEVARAGIMGTPHVRKNVSCPIAFRRYLPD